MAYEELPDVPLYYVADHISKVLHITTVPMLKLRSAILNAGYQVTSSHASKNSVKTNAPAEVIWDILRCWAQENPVNKKWMIEGSTTKNILDKPPQIKASFELHKDANPKS